MKSKHSSQKKNFSLYNNLIQNLSNNWGNDIEDVNSSMVVNTPANSTTSPFLPTANIAENNMFKPCIQTGNNNMSVTCGQGMNNPSIEPSNIVLTAISYGNNQPADLDLWDNIFFSTLIFEIDRYLDKDASNITKSI